MFIIILGDLNGDDVVNIRDLFKVVKNFGKTVFCLLFSETNLKNFVMDQKRSRKSINQLDENTLNNLTIIHNLSRVNSYNMGKKCRLLETLFHTHYMS